MTGQHSRVFWQHEQTALDGVDDLAAIPAGKVGAANAIREESVSGYEQVERREMQAYAALGVAWSVNHLGWIVYEANLERVVEACVGGFGLWRFDSQPASLNIHHLEQRQVILIEQNRRSDEAFQLECSADVVDVRVSNEYLFELEIEIREPAMNAADVVARIDDDRLASGWIAENCAVALERADREGLDDGRGGHEPSLNAWRH